MTDKEDEFDQKEFNKESINWALSHTVKTGTRISWDGKFELPTNYLTHPELSVEARERVLVQVENITTSIQTKGILEYRIVVLIWQQDLDKEGITIKSLLDQEWDEKPKIVYQVICGDHTVAAFQRLARQETTVKEFKKLWCRIIVCKKNDETVKYANSYGGLDNYVMNSASELTLVQITIKMHYKFIEIEERMDLTDKMKSAMKKQCRDTYVATSNYESTTLGSASAVASNKGEVWALLEQVLKGNYKMEKKGRASQVPKGISNYIHMANIPAESLCRWLERIICGHLIPRQFEAKCKLYKKTARVQIQIVSFVHSIRAKKHTINSWEKLCLIYPFFLDHNWINQLVAWVGPGVKEKIGPNIKQGIIDKIEQLEAEQKLLEEKIEDEVSVIFFIHVIFDMFFQNYQKK